MLCITWSERNTVRTALHFILPVQHTAAYVMVECNRNNSVCGYNDTWVVFTALRQHMKALHSSIRKRMGGVVETSTRPTQCTCSPGRSMTTIPPPPNVKALVKGPSNAQQLGIYNDKVLRVKSFKKNFSVHFCISNLAKHSTLLYWTLHALSRWSVASHN